MRRAWVLKRRTPLISPAMPEPASAVEARHIAFRAPEPNFVLAVALMIVASAFFAAMAGLIRYGSEGLHPFQLTFLRSAFGLLFMLPWLMKSGLGVLRTDRIGLITIRGIVAAAAMFSFFWALSVMPLAEAVALSFTAPFFVTILAVIFLNEIVRARRWTAIAVGFFGTMIILRPGSGVLDWPALAVLFSALMLAGAIVCVKMLSRTEPPNAIYLWMVIYLAPITLIPALFVWQDPSWEQLGVGAGIGFCGTVGHLLVTRAFGMADTTALMPFDFARLIFSAIVGFLFFSQVPDIWTGVGATIIAAAGIYIAHRETRAVREFRVRRAPSRPSSPGGRSHT